MNLVEIIIVSIGLAMDAFAVSICKGLAMKKLDMKKALIVGLWFGAFQGIMPLIGYILGTSCEKFITAIDHYIAFALLGFIGVKMLVEALKGEEEEESDDLSFKTMLTLAVATSIDALAVGIAYVCGYGSKNAGLTFTLIGVITFSMSVIGVKLGHKCGDKIGKRAEIAGGIILVLMGLKILLEHLGILII